jgi:hypothetical protein
LSASGDINRHGFGIMPVHRESRCADFRLAANLASCLDLLTLYLQGSSSLDICLIVGKRSRHRSEVLRFYRRGGSHRYRVTILSRLAFHRLSGGFPCH